MCRPLLTAMEKVARPVITAYHDDFAVHDAKVILAMQSGDVILWTPRACGSHLIVLARAGRPNQRAAEHFAAVQGQGEPFAWHTASLYTAPDGEGRWMLGEEPNAAEVVARFAAQEPGPDPVRELHL